MIVKKTLIMDEEQWNILEPMLGQYVVSENAQSDETKPIDFDAVMQLRYGTRISNILNDGCWDATYTFVGVSRYNTPAYCVRTIGDLKHVTISEYLKHRNAGKGSWIVLKEYISTL